MSYTPHASDVEMPIIYPESRTRKLTGDWHSTMRPCPRCGYRLACDGKASWVCNRCEYSETKDVRKYSTLGAHFRDSVIRYRFGERG